MRKRHVQQDLAFVKTRRSGAGRPPKNGKYAGEPHAPRKAFTRHDPLHVVIRPHRDIGYLRRRDIYVAVRRALVVTYRRSDFRVVHLSIQGTHVHLLVEAHDRAALARGMRGFEISAAKQINRTLSKRRRAKRRGGVFPDRYHVEIIKTRRGARHALSYVLNNWRKHEENLATPDYRIDPFSSASTFDGWAELDEPQAEVPDFEPLPVWRPKSWLLKDGWKMYGAISWRETPRHRLAPRRTRLARR